MTQQREEGQSRKATVIMPPPCESSFVIHYRGDEPYGLLIDGRPYRVAPLKRGTGIRDGDWILSVVSKLR